MLGSSYIAITFRLHRRAAFSLVEMLAVMGIIVLLLAATLPALRGLNQSESRRGAVGNVMATLDRARMMAISDGLNTYVVFACQTPGGSQINSDLWGRAYAIYEDGDNVSFNPQQKTPWLPLPKGIAFKVADGSNGTSGGTISGGVYTSVTNRTNLPSFTVTGSAAPNGPGTSATVQLPCWKFDATGAVVDPPIGVDPRLYRLLMFPGLVNASNAEISTQNTGSTTAARQMQLEEIDVNPVTGRAKYIIDACLMKTPLLNDHRPCHSRRRLRRAFSLVEVTLALGIITFGLVGVVGVLPTALTSGRQSFDQNRAAAIANTLFASIRSQPFNKVGYLDSQFDNNGTAQAIPTVAMLDLNSTDPAQSGLTPPQVQFHATFTGDVTNLATTTFSEQRRLSFAQTTQPGTDYLVTMYFNNQPDGMAVVPQTGTVGGTPIVPAQANRIELVVSPTSRPMDQYHFVSTVANRTN